jgi:hypothetical protein
MVDTIDIDFTGKFGHAVVNFNIDQDNVDATSVPVVLLSGFRLDNDSLHFGSVTGLDYEFSISSMNSFKAVALEYFNTGAQDTPVTGIFAGGASGLNKTFVAYDLDGSGVSAFIELDGVKLADFVNRYQSANGLG